MSKGKSSQKKGGKKAPQKTLKEKRAAKRDKKAGKTGIELTSTA